MVKKSKIAEQEIKGTYYEIMGLVVVFVVALIWIFISPEIFTDITSPIATFVTVVVGGIAGLYSAYFLRDII